MCRVALNYYLKNSKEVRRERLIRNYSIDFYKPDKGFFFFFFHGLWIMNQRKSLSKPKKGIKKNDGSLLLILKSIPIYIMFTLEWIVTWNEDWCIYPDSRVWQSLLQNIYAGWKCISFRPNLFYYFILHRIRADEGEKYSNSWSKSLDT